MPVAIAVFSQEPDRLCVFGAPPGPSFSAEPWRPRLLWLVEPSPVQAPRAWPQERRVWLQGDEGGH